MFAYCLNNPVNRIDILGNASIWYYLIVDHDMGFIHRLVQMHIIATNGANYTSEMTLDGLGRADVVDTNNGFVWEVKHAGPDPELRTLIAVTQATKYIGGTNGNTTIIALGPANTFEGLFYLGCKVSFNKVSYYEVRYTTPEAGAILYSVEEVYNYTGNLVAVYNPKKLYDDETALQALGVVGVFIGSGGGRFHSMEDIVCNMACTY